MKVITMESSAYKEMMAQIANIAGYIREARDEKKRKRETEDKLLLTSSLRTPKFFVKEFSYFLMPCHQHGLRINLLVQR